MDKSYSEQMEEQLEPRPGSKYKPIICDRFVTHIYRSEFFPVPSAHEEWMRNRIPRGAYYDSADDGPEFEIIRRVWPVQILQEMEDSPYKWFNVGPVKNWDDGSVDSFDHRRE